ncbi:MAG: tetratricopeptide repeat protein, partial [Melioribacteraceae bacterium]|nr:tetratricopeptide repeat protein [Melioribacteraceae bacterium]
DSYDHLKERLELPDKKTDQVSEKINDFYIQQLNIDKSQYGDRVRVDRIITYSEKTLRNGKFCKFLVELGRICLAEGKLELANEIFRKANKLSTDDLTKANSFLGMADVFSRKANWSRSLEMISQAKFLFKSSEDYKGLAKCENLLGTIYGELGDILKAKKYLLSSLSLINTDNDTELAANLYSNLGIVYHIQEDSGESIKHLEKALELYESLGKDKNSAEVNLNIGLVHFDLDEYDKAILSLDKAIDIAAKGNYLSILCLVYHAKSEVLIKQKDYYYASEFADKALEISHSADDKLTIADIYKVKGIVARELKDFEAAETYLLNSLRINKSFNNEMNAAEVSFELGILYEKTNDTKSKQSFFNRSKEYYSNTGAPAKAEMINKLLENYSAS